MHLFQIAVAVIGAIVTVQAGINRDCASPSVITITISNTETLSQVLSSSVATLSSIATASSAGEVSTTFTIYSTYTSFVSVVQPVSTSSTIDQGPYYFSVHEDSTVWLGGKTPPVTDSCVTTAPTTVLVEPVPSSLPTSSAEEVPITSTKTVFLTSFITKHPFTETVTEASSLAPTSIKLFTSPGFYGWNTSTSTSRKVSVGANGSGTPSSDTYATGTAGFVDTKSALYSETAPVLSRRNLEKMKARQAGTFITATINGVVVSWIWPPPTTPAFSNASPIAASIPYAAPSITPSSLWTTITSDNSGFALPTTFLTSPVSLSLSDSTTSSVTSLSPVISTGTNLPTAAIPFSPPSAEHSGLSTTVIKSLISVSSTPVATDTGVSVTYLNMSTTSTAIPSPTSSVCVSAIINSGNFTINFDDLPSFSTGPDDTTYPPIFSTYHKLFWANGYSYAPPPSDPFCPVSPPQLAVFVNNATANALDNGTQELGAEGIGEFGAGPRYAESAYWIDVYSAYLGCNNSGPAECMISFNGFVYEPNFGNTVLDALQVVYQPPCPGLTNCALVQYNLNDEFRGLVGLQIVATVNDVAVSYFMDNLEVGWSNNSCAAGQLRDSGD